MKKKIPYTNEIMQYFHCGACSREFCGGHPDAAGKSPAEYARLNVGWTKLGVQIWCVRHDANVLHVDFEGQRHPSNSEAFINERVAL